MTRSAFIVRGALATTAALGTSAASGFVGRAMAQGGDSDADVFRLALTLELLEDAFYKQALRRVDMSPENRRLAELVGGHETEHVIRIQQVLDRLGESYSAERNLRFTFPLGGEAEFLALAVKLEDTGVSAYSGSAPQVRSSQLLALAGSIVQTEARHASALRAAAGQPFAPRAFDRATTLTRAVGDAVPYIQRL